MSKPERSNGPAGEVSNGLRKELFSLISWHLHSQDSNPMDTVCRLIEKAGGIPSADFSIMETTMSGFDLKKIQNGTVNTRPPRNRKAPIILVMIDNRLKVLDGQKRITRMKFTKHRVRCLIIECRKKDCDEA